MTRMPQQTAFDITAGLGLMAEFFTLRNSVSRLGEIDFERAPDATDVWEALDIYRSHDPFWEGGPRDNFAARYTGFLNLAEGGSYTFFLTSDDGSALYINGVRVVDNDGLHATRERQATLDLQAGAHEIQILYFERTGAQTLRLEWQGPDSGGDRTLLQGRNVSFGAPIPIHEPQTVDATGLKAEFFVLAQPVSWLREIDFDRTPDAEAVWDRFDILRSHDPFWEGGPRDHFAARFTGSLNVSEGGRYTFFLTSDDGSALYINGVRVIDNDGTHATLERRVTLDLEAGAQEIMILYFERAGAQSLRLEWQGPDSGGVRSLVEGSSLSHAVPAAALPPADDLPEPPPPAEPPAEPEAPGSGAPEAPAPVMGLKAEFFVLAQPVFRLREIDFDRAPDASGVWERFDLFRVEEPFWEGGPRDHFAARFTGALNVAEGGSYTFFLTSDDGSALYINGVRVIDNDGQHGPQERRVTLELDAGAHDVVLLYFEHAGRQTLRLEWQGPDSGGVRSLVEGSSLSHAVPATVLPPADDLPEAPPPAEPPAEPEAPGSGAPAAPAPIMGLKADFFALAQPVSSLREIDFARTPDAQAVWERLDVYRSQDPFWEGGPRDHFAARYTGLLNVAEGGSYTFFLTSDDGSALYINGIRVIDNDGTHSTRERRTTLELGAGAYEVAILYFERTGAQTLRLEWQGPDNGGVRGLVEGESLFHLPPQPETPPSACCPTTEASTCYCDCQPDEALPPADGGTEAGGGAPGHDHGTPPQSGGEHGGGHDHGSPGDPPGAEDGDHGGHGNPGHDDTGTPGHGEDHGDPGTSDPGHGGHHGGHDHGSGNTPPPRTPEEIEAFVRAVMAEPDHHDHDHHGAHPRLAARVAQEHGQLLDLVPRSEATHVAIGSGSWFDPATWHEGRIPDAGAKVLIPRGIAVTYDGESAESLFTVRVDGTLSFATDRDTKMVLDTMVVSDSGRLEIGTAARPVEAGVNARIIFADNGDIDVTWDPALLSRGLLTLGSVEIHGAEKTAFLKVAEAPMRGDTVIRLAEAPEGWQVGDSLVVTGTHKTPLGAPSQDQVVRIVAIDGAEITIDQPLLNNHDTPRADLFAYVANMTRNITFESENGADSAHHHRGHVMFMHSNDVDVRYAAFDHLGRTDKSKPAFDLAAIDSIAADSNVKGRYSFHFHLTGTQDQEAPAIALGNTVTGSIGWGFVHHSSHANFTENVAFDVFGAAFAAEDGDETGIWLRNMAINVTGVGWGTWTVKNGPDVHRHDNGRSGEGFFFAGRAVEAAENVAANTTHGFVWMTRSAPLGPLAETLDHPAAAYGRDAVGAASAHIHGFRNNEAFGTDVALIVIKASPHQGHNVRSVMDGFLAWETHQGVNLTYTGQYTLLDFDLLAAASARNNSWTGLGLVLGNRSQDMVVNGLTVDGFHTGVIFAGTQSILIDPKISGARVELRDFNPDTHKIISASDLTPGRLEHAFDALEPYRMGQSVVLTGVTTDSIGEFQRTPVTLTWVHNIAPLLAKEGYYTTPSGQNVLLIPDIVADRATGDLMMMTRVLYLDMTHSQIQNNSRINAHGGATWHGVIVLDGAPPEAEPDLARTRPGQDVLIDVLANDSDPDGGPLRIGGVTDPGNGDVFIQADGQILYRPNHGFTGTDSFHYWAQDASGQLARATVTVEVWDL